MFYSGFPPHQAFNPFDDMDNMVQAQDSDEFQEFDQVGEKGLTEFLDQEEKECLEKNQFLEEEPMEEPQNTSGFSGISDQSIVLRNNRLWAGDTSGVNLEKLREETRLSRCEYFRHNSSRYLKLFFLKILLFHPRINGGWVYSFNVCLDFPNGVGDFRSN